MKLREYSAEVRVSIITVRQISTLAPNENHAIKNIINLIRHGIQEYPITEDKKIRVDPAGIDIRILENPEED